MLFTLFISLLIYTTTNKNKKEPTFIDSKKIIILKNKKARLFCNTLLILCLMIISLTVHLVSCGYMAYTTFYTNIEDYNHIWNLSGVRVGNQGSPSVFPDNIEGLLVEDFFCRYDEKLPLGEGLQVFLNIQYNDKMTFDSELKLLKELSKDNVENLFSKLQFETYIVNLGEGYYYEYALVDESEQKVIYIYLQGLPKDEIEFDHIYLPDNYTDYGKETQDTHAVKPVREKR